MALQNISLSKGEAKSTSNQSRLESNRTGTCRLWRAPAVTHSEADSVLLADVPACTN